MPTKTPKTPSEKAVIKSATAKTKSVESTAPTATKKPQVSAKATTIATPIPTSLDALRTAFAALSAADQRLLLAEWNQAAQAVGNPVSALVEYVQKEFGANLTTEVWTEGAAHVPVVYCKIIMPDGTEYTASGKNQKIAKQLASEEALADLQKTLA